MSAVRARSLPETSNRSSEKSEPPRNRTRTKPAARATAASAASRAMRPKRRRRGDVIRPLRRKETLLSTGEKLLAEPDDVARAHRQQHVARAHPPRDLADTPRLIRHIDDFPAALSPGRVGHELACDPLLRFLAGGIDVHHDRQVAAGQGLAKRVREVARAREEMRLEE